MGNDRELKGVTFSWKRFLIILAIFLLAMLLFNCAEKDPIPEYEIVPVVQLTHPLLGTANFEVDGVRLDIHVSVNGVERPREEFYIDYWSGRQCPRIEAKGSVVEYDKETPTVLRMWVVVYYSLESQGGGWVLLTNFDDNGDYQQYSFLRAFFEVRDKNNPSDKFVGIEADNSGNTTDDDLLFPFVEWRVGDMNGVPTGYGQASTESCDCIQLN